MQTPPPSMQVLKKYPVLVLIATGFSAVLGLSGCDYWPPALQSEIEVLRAELNDALDDRQRLDQEIQDLRSQQSALQREVEEKARENGDLRDRLTTPTAMAPHVASTPKKPETSGEASLSPMKRGTYAVLQLAQPMTQGPRVVQLQRLLRRHGIPIRIDGRYGSTTAAAVRGFQRAHGLPVDGIVGPTTFTALHRKEPTVRLVRHLGLQRPLLTGHDVQDVQRVLRRAGYGVTVDGHYGPETRVAVAHFQQKCGLEPDGVVGPKTWTCLKGKY